MLKCVIFDFDLTLVNLNIDDQVLIDSFINIYIEGGVPKNILEKYKDAYIMVREIPEKIGRLESCKLDEVQRKALAKMTESELTFLDKAELLAGSREALEEMKAQGKKVGVVSSNSAQMIKRLNNRFGLSNLIDAVVGRESPGRAKPHPDKIALCLRLLGCQPDESLLVGDRAEDIVAGKKAGVYSIGVLTGSHDKQQLANAGADRIIDNISQLPPTLKTAAAAERTLELWNPHNPYTSTLPFTLPNEE